MQFYGGGNAAPTSGGSGPGSIFDNAPGLDVGGIPTPSQPADTSIGKFNVDLTNPGSTIESLLGGAVKLGSGIAGGAAGLIGNLGFGGGTIGGAAANAAGAVGQVAGAVGSVPLPFVPLKGITPQGAQGAHVGDIPGEIGNIVGLPGQAVQRFAAGQRVESAKLNPQTSDLPPDILAQLDAGQLTVSQAADELVKRNAGFTSAPLTNLGLSLVLDPMNFIGAGLGKLGTIGHDAGIAVKAAEAGDQLGIGQRVIGSAYNAVTRNLPSTAHAATDAILGKATSGIFHSLGTRPFTSIASAADRLSPDYGNAIRDAMGVGNANIVHSAVADLFEKEATHASGQMAQSVLSDLHADPLAFNAKVAQRVTQLQALDPGRLNHVVEDFLDHVKGEFVGVPQDELRATAAQKLALVTGMSVEDAGRVLPKTIDRNTAATVHLLTYGKVVDDLEAAKAASVGKTLRLAEGQQLSDLTTIAPDTLTRQRAEALIAGKSESQLRDAVDRYETLNRRYSGRPFDQRAVMTYLKQVRDVLPSTFEAPTTGKNPLPEALGAWRAKWGQLGYDIGFAPKDGLKMIRTPDGEVIPAMPFLPATAASMMPTVRNPLGRVFDGMTRGITQAKIQNEARYRITQAAVDRGWLTRNEARGFYQTVLGAAIDRGVTPRGLGGPQVYSDLMEKFLGPTRYAQFREAGGNATWLANFGFQNTAGNVGLTQALTGAAKTATSEAGQNAVSRIAEGIYPSVRFSLSPMFWAQELFEAPFWATMHGAFQRTIDPAVHALYGDLIKSNPEVRNMFEAGVSVQLAGAKVAERMTGSSTLLGKALSRFPDMREWKQKFALSQVLKEHGEQFRSAMESVNPRLVRTMEDAYGTNDWNKIAQSWAKERLNLASNPEGAVKALNRVLPRATSADEQTVYNAFQYSLGEAMRSAAKTQYFNVERNWLERTLNHPYLGFYPLSYMWGKVLPEYARFLLLRPFGFNAPLTGYAAAQHVQTAVQAQLANDPNFAQYVKTHPDTLYALQLFLPGTPTDMPANAPAWLRHAITGRVGNQPFTPATEATSALTNIGIGRDLSLVLGQSKSRQGIVGETGGTLSDLLGRSAKEYDSTVVPQLAASVRQAEQNVTLP